MPSNFSVDIELYKKSAFEMQPLNMSMTTQNLCNSDPIFIKQMRYKYVN